MFTFFLVDEDLSQRLRRMSQDKPELFQSSSDSSGAAGQLNLLHAASNLSLNSQIILEESNLPIVIVTNTLSLPAQTENTLSALYHL